MCCNTELPDRSCDGMKLKDPIELYRYPEEWFEGLDVEEVEEVKKKISTGLYIFRKTGWLRRGITTATTASAALNAAIKSCFENVEEVKVLTPSGIKVKVNVVAEEGWASVRKFSGDHEFDVTDGIEITAEVVERKGIYFGEGIGMLKGKKAVSRSAIDQIRENFLSYSRIYGFGGGVVIEVPGGKSVAEKTKNEQTGVKGGISILGTTGFVEPWCKELVKTKIEIAKQYERIAVTTGRKAWRYAIERFPDYQPFVFGVYLDEILSEHKGEKILIGFPGLLSIWAGGKAGRIEEKAKSMGVDKIVIL